MDSPRDVVTTRSDRTTSTEASRTRDGLMDGSSRYLPTLDGWRAVAIVGVILAHGRESLFAPGGLWENPALLIVFSWGGCGVDLFFAISGFLITTRLLEETRRDGRFSLRRFYARRGFRILPPYLLYLVVIGCAGYASLLQVSGREIRDCLLFVRNYTMNLDGVYTNHFWSLAVEEHFYLLWPLLLLAAGPRRIVWLVPLLGLAVHAWRSLDARYHLFAMVLPDSGVFFRTDTRIDALLWGCFGALVLPKLDWIREWRGASWVWVAVLAALVLVVFGHAPMLPFWLALLFPLLLINTVMFPRSIAGRVLEWTPLRWVGRMSYSLYLWQTLFLQSPIGPDPFFGLPWLKEWPWNASAILAIATVSYYFVERPMIRLGHRVTGHHGQGSARFIPTAAIPLPPEPRSNTKMTPSVQPALELGQCDISVILVTWNSYQVTADALDSIREHVRGITYEVFVVDNGTTKDDTQTELPRQFPWVRFIANPDNRGFTRANNQGIREARGRYVLLLNNDTVQTENALGEAVQYMNAHSDVGALGIMHRNNDGGRTFQPSFFGFPQPWAEIRGLLGLGGRLPPTPEVKEQDVDWVCGSFLLMRRACLEQIGPLDERYFIYDEDIDWCLQASRAGWKIRFWPVVSMIHLGAQANPFMRDKTLVMFRSHISYLRKNHGWLAAAGYYFGMGLKLTLAAGKQVLRLLVGRATRADVRQRWQRLRSFLTLRPGRVGG
jgi:peptidoglycan/LPS O-acetylase OafA/YrhL/GT2 family glycosyltransferase